MSFISPPDAAIREQALDITLSFIVQAPAGSGKTELLTRRILALLAYVQQPEEIVAITFTRKAAAEMRERVLSALKRGLTKQPELAHEQETWKLAQSALLRDKQLGWNLLQNPNRLRITTIDALCLNLVGQMPILSRLGIQPQVTSDPQPIYQAAVAKLFDDHAALPENYQQDIQTIFQHFHYDINYMTELFITMLQYREQWIPYAVLGHTEEFKQRLQDSLNNIILQSLQDLKFALEQTPTFFELLSPLNYALGHLQLPALLQWPGYKIQNLTTWNQLISLFLTEEGSWRKTVTKKQGFPAPTDFKNKDEKAQAQFYKNTFIEFLKSQQDNDLLCEKLQRIRALPASDHYEQLWPLIAALLRVLMLLASELQLQFQAIGKTDFTQIAYAAKQALGEYDHPSDLLLMLDNQIKHLLVDEFQDTSKLQFELIEKLTLGWEPADGRTLFLVGDPMQSIYRFRQAEVGLFIKASQEGIGLLPLVPLKLSANFRSDKAIIHWLNEVFSTIFPAFDDIPSGAISYAPSVAMRHFEQEEQIVLHPYLQENQFELQLLQQLNTLTQQQPEASIAILVRSRRHAMAILPWLRAAKLPYQAVDIEALEYNPLIYDLLALTKALFYLGDKTAWLSILRAPWCGLTLTDLLVLAEAAQNTCLWEVLQEKTILTALSEDGQIRLLKILPILSYALMQRERLPLRLWVEHTWVALGGPACLSNRSTLTDAENYFNLLALYQSTYHHFDLSCWEKQLEAAYASSATNKSAAIQIMTMHKSKGLEFDVVILPNLHENSPGRDKNILVWMDQPRSEHENDILLSICQPAGVENDKLYQLIRTEEQRKNHYETIRVLYVAATRAKKQLHLYFEIQEDQTQPHGFLGLLWPHIAMKVPPLLSKLPAIIEEPEVIPTELASTIELTRLPTTWNSPIKLDYKQFTTDNAGLAFTWQLDTERRMGIVLHQVFKFIGIQGTDHWQNFSENQKISYLRPLVLLAGISSTHSSAIIELCLICIEKMLIHEKGAWLSKQLKNSSAQLELSISTLSKNELKQFVLDATFLDEKGSRWIIDYKTADYTGEKLNTFLEEQIKFYRPQLEKYAQLMQKIEPRSTNLVLYFPRLEYWFEWNFSY